MKGNGLIRLRQCSNGLKMGRWSEALKPDPVMIIEKSWQFFGLLY